MHTMHDQQQKSRMFSFWPVYMWVPLKALFIKSNNETVNSSSSLNLPYVVRGRQRVRRERRLANQRTPLSPEERHLQVHFALE